MPEAALGSMTALQSLDMSFQASLALYGLDRLFHGWR
jgi:hypothetical protein